MTDDPNEPNINNNQITASSYEPEDRDDTPLFNKRSETQMMKSLFTQTLEKALRPDPTRVAMETAMGNLMAEFVTQKITGGSAPAKTGMLNDFMNSQMGAQIGANIFTHLPATIESLGKVLGKDKANALVEKTSEFIQQQQMNEKQKIELEQQNNMMKQQNAILNLDPKNPEHISQYTIAMAIDPSSDVQEMLISHQKRIQQTLIQQTQQKQSTQSSQPQQNQVSQQETQEAIMVMIQEMKAMKAEIQNLKGEKLDKSNKVIENISDNKWDDDEAAPAFAGTLTNKRDSTLFNSAIKVDVDQISGDRDPFFKEQPKEQSVLIEEKDKYGKSSFRMSDDDPKKKIEIKHQAVKPIKNVVEMKKEKEPIDVEKMNDALLEELNDTKETIEETKEELKNPPEVKEEVPPEEIKETVEEKEEPEPVEEKKDEETIPEEKPKLRKIVKKV